LINVDLVEAIDPLKFVQDSYRSVSVFNEVGKQCQLYPIMNKSLIFVLKKNLPDLKLNNELDLDSLAVILG